MWPISHYPGAAIAVAWTYALPSLMFQNNYMGILWALLMPRIAISVSHSMPPHTTYWRAFLLGIYLGGLVALFAMTLRQGHYLTTLSIALLYEASLAYALRLRKQENDRKAAQLRE